MRDAAEAKTSLSKADPLQGIQHEGESLHVDELSRLAGQGARNGVPATVLGLRHWPSESMRNSFLHSSLNLCRNTFWKASLNEGFAQVFSNHLSELAAGLAVLGVCLLYQAYQ
jgi:hypothetical protein